MTRTLIGFLYFTVYLISVGCASAEVPALALPAGGSCGREIDAATPVDRSRPGEGPGNDIFGGRVSSVDDSRN
jgi:hypothetical protein